MSDSKIQNKMRELAEKECREMDDEDLETGLGEVLSNLGDDRFLPKSKEWMAFFVYLREIAQREAVKIMQNGSLKDSGVIQAKESQIVESEIARGDIQESNNK